jgi:hypothetical protein
MQAHLVLGLLEEQGIRSFVEGEMLFGVRGDVGMTPASLPKVSVADDDAARAVEILSAHERNLERERREEDPDAAVPPPLLSGTAKIVLLWVLVLAATAPFGRAVMVIAVPIVAVCAFVHVVVHANRVS